MSVFIDSRILVYAHDESAGEKHFVANRLIRELWELPVRPVISVQVCKELWRVLNRCEVMGRPETADLVRNYLQWEVIPEDEQLLATALELRGDYDLSVWDACILAAARRAGVTQLWRESLEAGREYGGVTVLNPLVV